MQGKVNVPITTSVEASISGRGRTNTRSTDITCAAVHVMSSGAAPWIVHEPAIDVSPPSGDQTTAFSVHEPSASAPTLVHSHTASLARESVTRRLLSVPGTVEQSPHDPPA